MQLPLTVVTSINNSAIQPSADLSTGTFEELILYYDKAWQLDGQKFKLQSFNTPRFVKNLQTYLEKNKLDGIYSPKDHFGVVQKAHRPLHSRFFARGDIHGDLKSFIENVKALQKEGLFDAHFRLKEGASLVLLGDYGDRGEWSLEVIELLLLLKIGYKEQVFLLRGNHEYLTMNRTCYDYHDTNFTSFMSDSNYSPLLEAFYATLPLALFISQDTKPYQYIRLSHAIGAEPTLDLFDFLHSPQWHAQKFLPVPKERKLPERYINLAHAKEADGVDPKLIQAAQKIVALVMSVPFKTAPPDDCFYNWSDPALPHWPTSFGGLRIAAFAKSDLDAINLLAQVSFVVHGHNHLFHSEENYISLPVGSDCFGMQFDPRICDNPDRVLLLETGPTLKEWKKTVIGRHRGDSWSLIFPSIGLLEQDNSTLPSLATPSLVAKTSSSDPFRLRFQPFLFMLQTAPSQTSALAEMAISPPQMTQNTSSSVSMLCQITSGSQPQTDSQLPLTASGASCSSLMRLINSDPLICSVMRPIKKISSYDDALSSLALDDEDEKKSQ